MYAGDNDEKVNSLERWTRQPHSTEAVADEWTSVEREEYAEAEMETGMMTRGRVFLQNPGRTDWMMR